MNQLIIKPQYKHKPIYNIATLARVLDLPEKFLLKTAKKANKLYKESKNETIKSDGKKRETFNVLGPLRLIQSRIKVRILREVNWPHYLLGGLPGRTYRQNAAIHAGAKILIKEDIENFFPATTAKRVFDIWRNFFDFSEEVSNLLVKLCTKDGYLPQGALTSSYLANLVFWASEFMLVKRLESMGFIYTRFVDDVTLSSKAFALDQTKTDVISQVYGMFLQCGYYAKRTKHRIYTSAQPMPVHNLLVNRKQQPSFNKQKRKNLRAKLYQIEQKTLATVFTPGIRQNIHKINCQIGVMKSLHPNILKLKNRTHLLNELDFNTPVITKAVGSECVVYNGLEKPF